MIRRRAKDIRADDIEWGAGGDRAWLAVHRRGRRSLFIEASREELLELAETIVEMDGTTGRLLRRAATNGAVWALLQAARLCPHSGLVPAGAIRAMADELLHAERIVPAEVATSDSSPAPLTVTGSEPEPINDAPIERVSTQEIEGSKG